MSEHKHTPSSYVDDISIRHRYRLPESARERYSSTKRCPGTVMLPERNRDKFTDLYPSGYQNRSLGRCSSTLGNSSYSHSRAFHSTKHSSPQHAHLTRSHTMPYYLEESQVNHKKGWCISQMSKWHVTLLSGWSSTHMIGSYFNLFTDGPIKYFDSMDSTHTFKLDVTCPTIDEDACDETCEEASDKVCDNARNRGQCRNKTTGLANIKSKDNFRRRDAAPRITHLTRQVDSGDLKVCLSSSASKPSVTQVNKSSANAVERRFKEIAVDFVQEVSAKGSEILELVSLTFSASNQTPILGKRHRESVKSSNVDAPCLMKSKKEIEPQRKTSDSSKLYDYTNPLAVSCHAYSKDVVAVSPLIVTVSAQTYNEDIITALDSKEPLDLTSNANVKDTDFYCSRLEATTFTYSSPALTYDKPHLTHDTLSLEYHKPHLIYDTPPLALYNKPNPTYETPGLTYNTTNLTYNTPCLTYSNPPPTYDTLAQTYDTHSKFMITNGNIFETNNTESGNTRSTTDAKTSESSKRAIQEHQNRQPKELAHYTNPTHNEHNIRYTPAMIMSNTTSYLAESARCAEIPGEGHRPAKYHSSSTWKDAVSNAWREGMSASWRHAPVGGCYEAPSASWRRSLVTSVPDKEVTTASSGKCYTLRDEVSLRLSAVYSMGVRVTRAIIGRHTEVQPTRPLPPSDKYFN